MTTINVLSQNMVNKSCRVGSYPTIFELGGTFLYFREVFLYNPRRVAASDVLIRRWRLKVGGTLRVAILFVIGTSLLIRHSNFLIRHYPCRVGLIAPRVNL
jgi:hypothetical protein